MTTSLESVLPSPSLAVLRLAGADVHAPFQLAEESRRLPEGSTAALVNRARSREVSLSSAIRAAWAVLLSAYSRESGVWFAAGTWPGVAAVCRLEIPEYLDVWEWIAAIERQKSLPQIPISATDTVLTIGNGASESSATSAALRVGMLSVSCEPGEELAVRARYDRRCYAADDIAILVEQFLAALSELAVCGTKPPRSLSLFSDRDLALAQAGQPREPLSTQHTVVSLFRAQAQETPDAVACSAGDQDITYAELEEKVLELARTLRGLSR
jgi:hypothetical protein